MSKRQTGRARQSRPAPASRRVATSAGPPPAAGGFATLLEQAQREVLVVSLCAVGGLPEGASSATVRMKGQRLHVSGKPGPGDRFVHEETVAGVPGGSGPLTITRRVRDVNPGEWRVSGELVPERPSRGGGASRGVPDRPIPLHPANWSWRARGLSSDPDAILHTAPEVFSRRPGVLRGSWALFVAIGVVAAMVLQASLASRRGLGVGSTLLVSALAVLAGGIGAKAWYVILERRRRRWDGWAIQGFVFGLLVVAVLVVPLLDLHLGDYLDITAPALLLGMSIGRVGCFFAGCCGGRPTCARHGIWASDRRIGTRRIPTQLFESALALSIAVLAYAVVRGGTPRVEGATFVAAVALYTLCRQAILRYRAEGRHSTRGTWITAAGAAVVLLAAAAVTLGG